MNWSAAKLGSDILPATQSDYLSQKPLISVVKHRLILLGHMVTKVLQNDSNANDQIRSMLLMSKQWLKHCDIIIR